jgi:putative hydrolase of the HAD superfamily
MLALLPPIRAIFFDAVGTLIHPDPPAGVVYAAIGRRFGSRLDPETVGRRFRAAFRRQEDLDAGQGLRTSEDRERRRWQAIVAEVLDDVTDGAGCFQELYAYFARPEIWRVDPEAATALGQLAGRGLLLGLCSNFDSRLRRVAAGRPELAALRHLVISSEVGWRKPAAPFFAQLAECTMLPAEQILVVGDDPDNDHDGARAAGLQAILFDPRRQADPGVLRITHLSELLHEVNP